jgi:hypothetical protein
MFHGLSGSSWVLGSNGAVMERVPIAPNTVHQPTMAKSVHEKGRLTLRALAAAGPRPCLHAMCAEPLNARKGNSFRGSPIAWTPRTLSPAGSAHPKLTRPRIQSIKNLKEPHLQGVLVPAQPEDIDMFQHQFPLLPEAAGQAGGSPAFSAGPSLAAPTAHGGEAVPTGQPLPRQGKRHRACSPRRPCSREAAASFTPILTVLAGAMQWIYCPAPRVGFPNCRN